MTFCFEIYNNFSLKITFMYDDKKPTLRVPELLRHTVQYCGDAINANTSSNLYKNP